MAKRTGTKQKKTASKARAAKATPKKVVSTTKPSEEAVVLAPKVTPTKTPLGSLNKWNFWLAGLHAAQGIIVLLLSTTKVFPIQTSYQTLDPIATQITGKSVFDTATRHLFDINLAYLVAAFFFIAAITHLLLATAYRSRYEANLGRGTNKARWIETGLSTGTMLVAIGVLSGICDISTLLLIFVLSLIMGLAKLAMEIYNQGKPTINWLAYIIGAIAGIAPWFVLVFYLYAANVFGSSNVAGYLYGIYASLFILSAGFAVNMYLQYKKVGKWKDPVYGERAYMILSLAAKTALAWQIFAGVLRP